MSTTGDRKVIEDTMKRHITLRSDAVMWNLLLAMKEITTAIDDLDAKIGWLSRQVARPQY